MNKSSLCVPADSLTQTLPVLSVQRRQGGSGTTAHVSSMLLGFPPSISLSRNMYSAMLKTKGEGPLCAPAMLLTNRRSFHTLPVSLSALQSPPTTSSHTRQMERKKKNVHEKQLLGFAFSRTPAETVSVCVCCNATLATRYGTSVGPEQKATGGRGRGTQGQERAERPGVTALLREELTLAFNHPEWKQDSGCPSVPQLRKTPWYLFCHSPFLLSSHIHQSCACPAAPRHLSSSSTCQTRCQIMTASHPSAWTVATAAWTWPTAAWTPCPLAHPKAWVPQRAFQRAPPAPVSTTSASSATSWCTTTWTRTSWTTSWGRTPWNRWWGTRVSSSTRESATAILIRPCCQFCSSSTGMLSLSYQMTEY